MSLVRASWVPLLAYALVIGGLALQDASARRSAVRAAGRRRLRGLHRAILSYQPATVPWGSSGRFAQGGSPGVPDDYPGGQDRRGSPGRGSADHRERQEFPPPPWCSADAHRAVLAYVDQTTRHGFRRPDPEQFRGAVTMDNVDSRWLISGF